MAISSGPVLSQLKPESIHVSPKNQAIPLRIISLSDSVA